MSQQRQLQSRSGGPARSDRPRSTSPSRSSRSVPRSPISAETRRAPSSPSPSSMNHVASPARRKRSLPVISLPLVATLSTSSSSSADDSEHVTIPPVPPLPFTLMAPSSATTLYARQSSQRPIPTSPGDPFYLTRKDLFSSSGMSVAGSSNLREAVPMNASPGYARGRRPHTAGEATVVTPSKPDPRLNGGWSETAYGSGIDDSRVDSGVHGGHGDRDVQKTNGSIEDKAAEARRIVVTPTGRPSLKHRTSEKVGGAKQNNASAMGGIVPTNSDDFIRRAPSPGIPVGSFVQLVGGTLHSSGSIADLSRQSSDPPSPAIQARPTPTIHVTPQKHRVRPSTGDRKPSLSEAYAENSSPGSSAFVSAPSSPASWNPPGVSPLRTFTISSAKIDSHTEVQSPLYSTPTTARTGKTLSAMKYREPPSPVSPSFLMSPPPDISTYASPGKRARSKVESTGHGKAITARDTARDTSASPGLSSGVKSAVSPRRPALTEAFRRASENHTTTMHGLGFGLGVLGSPAQMRSRRGSEGDSTMEARNAAQEGSMRSSAVVRDALPAQRSPTENLPMNENDYSGPVATAPAHPFRPAHHIHVHQPSPPAQPSAPHRPERSSRRPSTPSGSPSLDGAILGSSPRNPHDPWSSSPYLSGRDRCGRTTPLETIFSEDNLDQGHGAEQGSSWQSLLQSITMDHDEGDGVAFSPGAGVDLDDHASRSEQEYRAGSSPQPSHYRRTSPRLYHQSRRSPGDHFAAQDRRRDDLRAQEPFARHASGSIPLPIARPHFSSNGDDCESSLSKEWSSDHINIEYQKSHDISGSPSIELKRFSRLDLAEAVSAVMDSDDPRDESDDYPPSELQTHGRGQMARQLSAIQGLISDMGFSTLDSEFHDEPWHSERIYDHGDVGSSPPTDSSRRRSTTEVATPRAPSNVASTRRDFADLSPLSTARKPAPTQSETASPPAAPRHTSWGRQHHRRTSSASAHRRSASEDFVASRKIFMQPISETDISTGVPHGGALRTATTKKTSLKHRRSTSSIDRMYPASGSALVVPPPPLQRLETFDVAATGISSLKLDMAIANRSSKTWRASIADEDQFENLAQTYGRKEMRRQELIWELCETEGAFLADMQLVLRRFAQPLRTPQGRWIDGIDPDVTRLFDWLEDIVQIHLGINEKFQAMQAEQAPLILDFAHAFKPCVPHLTIHLPYLVRFEGVSRKIESLVRNTESEIGEYVRMQTAAPECKSMSLASYLLKPVQRLMKYPLFFKQIRDLTPPDHADHAATLSLLHATDAVIRVMQEVKAREEELESLRQLEGRIKGLPPNFTLARRERHLLYQGVLNRVMLSERDQMRLTAAHEPRESFHSSTESRTASVASRTSTSTAQSATSPLLSPQTDMSLRPDSMFSEASTADSSLAPSTKSSESAFIEFRSSALFRRPSMASSESSYADSRRPSTSSVPSLPHELKEQDRPKVKAKEVPLYLFVFSDIVLIATQMNERSGILGGRRGSTMKEKAFQVSYKLVDSCGIGRALALKDCSGQLGYQYLIELDLLSMQQATIAPKGKKQLPAMAPVSSPVANTIFLTLPDRSFAKMVIAPQNVIDQSYAKWLDGLHRSCVASHRTLSVSGSLSDLVDSHGVDGTAGGTSNSDVTSPKKCSSRVGRSGQMMSSASMYSLEEREEREWWARRYKAVKDEMARGMMGR